MTFDDRIREALQRALPPAETPEGLADDLIARAEAASPTGGGAGLGGTAMWIGVAALAGVILGGALGFFGGGDAPGGAVLGLDGVPIFACPGAGEVGALHRGDRVLITGRTDDGAWLTVRNVRGGGETVFIRAEHVAEDSDVSALPVRDCEDQGILVVGSATTTTLAGTTTTTTEVVTTTTMVEETTTTSTPPTTGTTPPPDVTPPDISNEAAVPGVIWEQDGLGVSCPPNTPRQSTISAFVTDNEGVTEVTASWTDPFGAQTVAMTGAGGTYGVFFGPYAAGDWDPLSVSPYEHEVSVTITAKDAAGNISSVGVEVTVTEIGECFG